MSNKYVILLKPNTNIPFFEEMKRLCLHEFQIMCVALQLDVEVLGVQSIGLGSYLSFQTQKDLTPMLHHFTRLSFYYTLFAVKDDWFKPCFIDSPQVFPDDLSNRLKYSGKTNEGFTRFVMNVAIYTLLHRRLQDNDHSQRVEALSVFPRLSILDPLSGKGTGLFEGIMFGHNVNGVDKDRSAVGECIIYFERYLKEGRYKHQVSRGRFSRDKENLGEMVAVSLGANKKEIKQKTGQQFRFHRGDTLDTHRFFKKESMDLLVSDLPYGIQHFSHKGSSKTRKLDKNEFLNACLASWSKVLKKDAVLALSWNTYTLSREDLITSLENQGFQVCNQEAYQHFAHRVSQAIKRDVVVAYRS